MGDSVKKYRQRRDARIRKRLDDFREGDHPRDENGRFISGGGGGNMPSGVRASLGKVGSGKALKRTEEAVETANLADDVRREFRSEKMREPDIGKGWAESRRKKAATSFKTVLNRIPDGEEFELTPKRGGGEVFKFKKQGQRYKGTYNGKSVDFGPADLFDVYVKNNNYGMKFKSYAENKRLRGDADMDAVEKYRKRRAARLGDRMDADDDDGRWVTTEKKHKIHINAEGEPDKGNPHVIKTMKSGGGSFKSGGKTWDKESLTKLWQGRGYSKKEAEARAEKDLKETLSAQKRNAPEAAAPKRENKTVSLGYQKYDLEKMTDEWKKRGYSEEGARERAEKEFKELENMADHKRGERGETYSSGKEAGDIARGTMVRMRPEWRRPEEGDKEYIMLEDYGDRALVGVANSNLALGSAETVGKEMIDVAMKDGKQFMHPRYEAQQKAKEAAAKPKKRKTAADKYKDRIASASLDMEELNKIVEEAANDNKISGPKYTEIYQAALDRVKNSGEESAVKERAALHGYNLQYEKESGKWVLDTGTDLEAYSSLKDVKDSLDSEEKFQKKHAAELEASGKVVRGEDVFGSGGGGSGTAGSADTISSAFKSKKPVGVGDFNGLGKEERGKLLDDAPAGAKIEGIYVKNGPHKGSEVVVEKHEGYGMPHGTVAGTVQKDKGTWWEVEGHKDPRFKGTLGEILEGKSKYYEMKTGGGSNGMVDAAKAEAKKLGTSTQMRDGDLYVATTTKQFNPSSTRGSHRIWGKVVDKPSPEMKHKIGEFGNFEAYSKGFWGEGDNDSYGYEFVLKKPKKNDGRMDDEEWITMNGTHVQIGDDGQVSKGPSPVKNVIKQSGGYKKGTKKPRASGSTGFKTVAEFKKALNDRNVAMAEKVKAEEAWKEAKAFRASMWDDEVGGRKSLGSLKKDISKYKKAGDKEKLEKAKHDYDRMKAWTDEHGEDLNKAVEDAEKKMNEATKAYEEIDKRINDFSESRKTPDTPELARPAKNAGIEKSTDRASSDVGSRLKREKADQNKADGFINRIVGLRQGKRSPENEAAIKSDVSDWLDSLDPGTELKVGEKTEWEPWVLKKDGDGKWTGMRQSGVDAKTMAERVVRHLDREVFSPKYSGIVVKSSVDPREATRVRIAEVKQQNITKTLGKLGSVGKTSQVKNAVTSAFNKAGLESVSNVSPMRGYVDISGEKGGDKMSFRFFDDGRWEERLIDTN